MNNDIATIDDGIRGEKPIQPADVGEALVETIQGAHARGDWTDKGGDVLISVTNLNESNR